MSRRTVALDSVPGLGGLYASAAASHLGSVVRPGRAQGPMRLPDLEYGVQGVRADPRRLHAYQRMMGDTLRDALPSVFVHGMVFPVAMTVLADRAFPLPLLGMIHLANETEHLRAIGADETLAVRVWAENLRPHHAGTMVDLVSEASVSEDLVWRGVSTYLAKGIWNGARPMRPAREDPAAEGPATGVWRLGADTGRRFAGVLGDYNPIHLGLAPARALGMRRHIAHGMYLAGRALAATAPHDGGHAWSVAFESPVSLPGTVRLRVETRGAEKRFAGWTADSTRRHFSGSVRPYHGAGAGESG